MSVTMVVISRTQRVLSRLGRSLEYEGVAAGTSLLTCVGRDAVGRAHVVPVCLIGRHYLGCERCVAAGSIRADLTGRDASGRPLRVRA